MIDFGWLWVWPGVVDWGAVGFGAPWVLVLLCVVPVVIWSRAFWGGRAPVVFGSASRARAGGGSVRSRLRWLPGALMALGVGMLVVSAARPREGIGETRTITRGVAIMACVDRSFSMTDTMSFGDGVLSRFEVVKRVLGEFVEGNGDDLPGRRGDLIGLVKFARLADTACPPVQTHSTLLRILGDMELAPYNVVEAGTSIGDATALAAARLVTIERYLSGDSVVPGVGGGAAGDVGGGGVGSGRGDPDFVLTGKAIILLTDGDEKTGRTRAVEAAELAAEWGIRVHAIGIGSPGGRFGFDEATLRRMADVSGGIYRRATSADGLRAVYREIDALEKTEVETLSSTSFEELFAVPLVVGLGSMVLSVLLGQLVFRRVA